MITLPGRTPIEACDLSGPSGELLPVKYRMRGSSPFSHLMGQAVVPAGPLLNVGVPRVRSRSGWRCGVLQAAPASATTGSQVRGADPIRSAPFFPPGSKDSSSAAAP
jgi:hypothetical protein